MDQERWAQVKEILDAAIQRPPSEHAAFLSMACSDDEALYREVKSLLDSYESAFLEQPVVGEFVEMSADAQPQLTVGQRISRYRIISLLGTGGMGEVYLAEDTTLGRKVALKLLPASVTKDEDRLRRFKQEARVASALNHPNIVTIFEVGQIDSVNFIATEFIDGQTLRQRVASETLELREALDIAIQVASALTAAHGASIVHRDIKPENIMLRRDGYVKVLDFGLAKLTERSTVSINSADLTMAKVDTDPGVVMGTAIYMSPEQARGQKMDARTDIFSLGILLYEMITGRVPFKGATTSDLIGAILQKEPLPLVRYMPEVPAELQWIVSKALRKEREERYQTARELLSDLTEIRHEQEIKSRLERSSQPELTREAVLETSGREAVLAVRTADEPAATTRETATPPTSSAEIILEEIKRHQKGAIIAVAVLVIAIGAIAVGLYKFPRNSKLRTAYQPPTITKLTATGKTTNAAISLDGKYVAYVVSDTGQQSLWLRQVVTAGNVQVAPPTQGVSYSGLTFSRDGSHLYFIKREVRTGLEGRSPSVLYQMPVLGVTTKRLMENVGDFISLSPDEKELAFVRLSLDRQESALMLARIDGTGERTLAIRRNPEDLSLPAWSPDGKTIACGAGGSWHKGQWTVLEVAVNGGLIRPITSKAWFFGRGIAWLPDGSGLVVSTIERGTFPFQLWYISYPDGETRQITNDSNSYSGASLTADSRTLVTVQAEHISHVWVAPDGDAARVKQITFGTDQENELSWTTDGRIVYRSRTTGNSDIWIMNADGGDQRQLTVDTGTDPNRSVWIDVHPTVTPDGRYILFISDRAGGFSIWRMDTNGDNPKQLMGRGGESEPHGSPDGKWVVYVSHESISTSSISLWKVPIDGGDSIQLSDKSITRPAVSPDGKLIACAYWDGQPSSTRKIAVLPFEGGPPVKTFDVMPSGFSRIWWTSDGSAITYVVTRGGVSNIWSQSMDGSPPKQLTDFKTDQIFFFAWSHDGRQLALARGTDTSDAVLISNFK